MLTSTDDSGVSVLARAVKVHSRDTFEAVLKVITHNLTQDEVHRYCLSIVWGFGY